MEKANKSDEKTLFPLKKRFLVQAAPIKRAQEKSKGNEKRGERKGRGPEAETKGGEPGDHPERDREGEKERERERKRERGVLFTPASLKIPDRETDCWHDSPYFKAVAEKKR